MKLRYLPSLGLLAAMLSAPLGALFAQVPPPVPALPDAERRTQYSISGTTCACSVNFALFGSGTDIDSWLEVWVAGTRYLSTDPSHGWALTSATGPLATIPRPVTNAVLTFTAPQTGIVQIVGANRPRRLSQLQNNQGVSARDYNQTVTDLYAIHRELWDKTNDVTGRTLLVAPGQLGTTIPSGAAGQNKYVGTDASGNLAFFGNPATLTGPTGANGTNGTNGLTLPGGRLTLISGVPAPISDQAGANTLYYTPAVGTIIPITTDGITFTMTSFSQVSQLTTDATKSPAAVIANANYDVFCWLDSVTFRCTRGDYWKTGSISVTISIASPGVVTCGTCTFNTNFNPPVVFTGTTPTGLVAGTTYWLLPLTVTTANVSATPGGSAINTTGSSSGVTAVIGDDFGTVYRSGTTSLTVVPSLGIPVNTSNITNGPAALRGTYVGTVRSDASSLLDMTFGGVSAGGSPALLNVFNQYNQVPTVAIVGDSTASWSYTTAAFRPMDNSVGNRVSFLAGTQTNPVDVARGSYITTASVISAFAVNGYSLDKITGPADRASINQSQAANPLIISSSIVGKYKPLLGAHFVQAVEIGDGTNATTFQGSVQAQFLHVETLQ